MILRLSSKQVRRAKHSKHKSYESVIFNWATALYCKAKSQNVKSQVCTGMTHVCDVIDSRAARVPCHFLALGRIQIDSKLAKGLVEHRHINHNVA